MFVVDSSKPSRLPEARKVLKKILKEEKLRNVPVMVLANKKDLPDSMTIREVLLSTQTLLIVKVLIQLLYSSQSKKVQALR